MKCLRCKRPLKWKKDPAGATIGFVHEDGGGLYWQKCSQCGWEGSGFQPNAECPAQGCGGELRDHHCAQPDRSSRRGFAPPEGAS